MRVMICWSDVIMLPSPYACQCVRSVGNSGDPQKKEFAIPTHCYFCCGFVVLCYMLMFCSVASRVRYCLLLLLKTNNLACMGAGTKATTPPSYTRLSACLTRTHTADFRAKHIAAEAGMLLRDRACCVCWTTDVRNLNPVFRSNLGRDWCVRVGSANQHMAVVVHRFAPHAYTRVQ